MCVYKNHAFIFRGCPPKWSGTVRIKNFGEFFYIKNVLVSRLHTNEGRLPAWCTKPLQPKKNSEISGRKKHCQYSLTHMWTAKVVCLLFWEQESVWACLHRFPPPHFPPMCRMPPTPFQPRPSQFQFLAALQGDWPEEGTRASSPCSHPTSMPRCGALMLHYPTFLPLVITTRTIRPQNVKTQKRSNHVTLRLPYTTIPDLTSTLASPWTSCHMWHVVQPLLPRLWHYVQVCIKHIWVKMSQVPWMSREVSTFTVHCQKRTLGQSAVYCNL